MPCRRFFILGVMIRRGPRNHGKAIRRQGDGRPQGKPAGFKRIDHRYLKVLVVAKALVAEVLDNFFAMPNRFGICLELDPNYIPMRDAILHVEEKLLHAITSQETNPVWQVWFRR
jgi:hypothetical protein